jgi:pSer/pThr/pTyr-binding forkhead associated (FHA) protein
LICTTRTEEAVLIRYGPMFTQPAPSPPTLATTTSPASPTRPSRLRGLSYLRNYTHNHLHSRDSSGGNSAHRLSLTRATSYPSPTSTPTASGPATSVTPAVRGPTQQTHSNLQRATPETGEGTTCSQDKSGLTSGWLPTVGGRSGVSRIATQSQSTPTTSSPALLLGNSPIEPLPSAMGRTRSENSQITGENGAPQPNGTSGMDSGLPSIRFSQHQDVRAPRPSLVFSPMSRTLPTGREVIRVGRYSERESQQNPASNVPSAAPVGFKSKVVSRRHCEFWYEDGAWYIKDVRSSSGTFLNHVRLSSPGTESKPFPVKDGDIVQLGIDFKGGEEMIFRCVKIRVELNRGWQNSLNSFK